MQAGDSTEEVVQVTAKQWHHCVIDYQYLLKIVHAEFITSGNKYNI